MIVGFDGLLSSAFLSLLVEHLETGLAVFQRTDADARAAQPLWVNQHFQTKTGYGLDSLKSKGLAFIESSFDDDPQQRIMDKLHGFEPFRARVQVRTSAGTHYFTWAKGQPISDTTTGVSYYVITLDDSADVTQALDSDKWSNTDAQDLTLEELRVNERFLRGAVAAAGVGLWEWHVPSSQVIYSPEWFTMLGYEPYEYPSGFATWELLSHSDDTVDILKKVDKAFQGELDIYGGRFRMKCKDGSWKWIKAEGRVTQRDATGQAVHIYGTHIDISAEMEREDALRAALEKAEEASKAKERFLAVMSHEIRTPLNGVMNMIDFVLDEGLPESQQDYLKVAQLSSRNLLDILNDTLDYSKLESGTSEVEMIPFSVRDQIDSIVALFTAKARTKSLIIDAHYDQNFPQAFIGDPTKFRQIVINLLGNAIKFTDQGSITLHLSYGCDDPNSLAQPPKGQLQVQVIDTGVGIPKAAQDRVFDSFTQADNSTSRRYGGTGLGLSITKKLVALLGGEIDFESVEGTGTRFIVQLPMVLSTNPVGVSDTAKMHERPDLTCLHAGVLVAEDHEINQKIIGKLLSDLNLPITFVDDGLQAVKACQKRRFDLILMDIQMPHMDGVTATKAIQKQGNPNCETPIIAVTANAIAGDKETYLAAGMKGYITKPIDRGQFNAEIAQHLLENRSWEARSLRLDPGKKMGSGKPAAKAIAKLPRSAGSEDALTQLIDSL